jgi:hypothetical protein
MNGIVGACRCHHHWAKKKALAWKLAKKAQHAELWENLWIYIRFSMYLKCLFDLAEWRPRWLTSVLMWVIRHNKLGRLQLHRVKTFFSQRSTKNMCKAWIFRVWKTAELFGDENCSHLACRRLHFSLPGTAFVVSFHTWMTRPCKERAWIEALHRYEAWYDPSEKHLQHRSRWMQTTRRLASFRWRTENACTSSGAIHKLARRICCSHTKSCVLVDE